MQIRYPVRITDGRLVQSGTSAHIREMIEQVLFTRPGERVNRPDFGCGLDLVVFEPGNTEIVSATQAVVRAALQTWLGDLIVCERVSVDADGPRIDVLVQYVDIRSRDRRSELFSR
jgi:phage baseplate assembly protein W